MQPHDAHHQFFAYNAKNWMLIRSVSPFLSWADNSMIFGKGKEKISGWWFVLVIVRFS